MSDLPLFDHVPHYPQAPGYRDKDTSRSAARAIASKASELDELVLRVLTHPMTDWEIARAAKIPFDSAQPCRSRLKARGKIVFSGEYGKSERSELRVKKWRVS